MLQCEADQLLRLTPAIQTVKPSLLQEYSDEEQGTSAAIDDKDMKRAIEQSKQLQDNDDESFQKVLAMSE